MNQQILKRTNRIKTLPQQQNRYNLSLSFKTKIDSKIFRHKLQQINSLIDVKRNNTNRIFKSYRVSQINKVRNSLHKCNNIITKPLNFYIIDCGNNQKLICKLLKQRGRWVQSTNKNGNNNFIWGYVNTSSGLQLKGHQILSRIPGSSQLTNKGHLYENISAYCQSNKLSINFLPITFHFNKRASLHTLQQNIEQFIDFYYYVQENTNLSNTWILKPTNMNQGRSIHLFNTFKQLSNILGISLGQNKEEIAQKIENYIIRNRSLIIQKYIENPLLIGGHKFDIRIWVLMDHLGHYYIFRQGYLRFTSIPYKLDRQSIKNNFIHLTNHCLQKHSPDYINKHNLQQMSVLKDYLMTKSEIYYDKIMKDIRQIVQISIKSTLGSHRVIDNRNKCFEIFGFDFMIDREMNVRLIEANCNPAITEDCTFLSQLLHKMINDAFKLTIDKIYDIVSLNSYSISRLPSDNCWQLIGKI